MRILITGARGFIGQKLAARVALAYPDAYLTLFDSAPPEDDNLQNSIVVTGDLTKADDRDRAIGDGVDLLFNLAAVPGGAAEADYALSRAVNIDGTLSLWEAIAKIGGPPRIVYASTIAVLGSDFAGTVDDATQPRPAMTYGAHKLMMEIALADLSRKNLIDGVSIRLPGIVGRKPGNVGMKSAFMSAVFYSLLSESPFTSPVSADATMWLMSAERSIDNLLLAANSSRNTWPATRALTLGAVRCTMAELVFAIANRVGCNPDLVSYRPDASLERDFGTYPPLKAEAAERAGFQDDGDVTSLAERVLADIGYIRPDHPPTRHRSG